MNGVAGALACRRAPSLVPHTVPEEVLQPANALNRLSVNSADDRRRPGRGHRGRGGRTGLGHRRRRRTFVLAGLAFAWYGSRTANRDAGRAASMLAELRTGWTEFGSRSWVWVVVVGFC